MKLTLIFSLTTLVIGINQSVSASTVDTGQNRCYGNSGEITCPQPGRPFYGQDAQYKSGTPSYRDEGDGTVTALETGLMWSKAVDKRKVGLKEAERVAQKMTLGGHTDWRVPNIKELYSLIDFRGYVGFSRGNRFGEVPSNAIPFINTHYFDFRYGDTDAQERYIDAQWLSSTKYVSTTMNGAETLFGVNFADGRIKGYGFSRPGRQRGEKKFFVRYVRGNRYGKNHFVDNGDGTVTDQSNGMTWMQSDSNKAMNWEEALSYAEKSNYAGQDDWRLPNAKELQYIVDYSRSPDTSYSPAIDPIFHTTAITNEVGKQDFPYYWTSTTHLDGPRPGANAIYIAFGRALGKMRSKIMDVHGAGAQRSDPKTGRGGNWHGPQGDAQRVRNYVRLVRGGAVKISTTASGREPINYPSRLDEYRPPSDRGSWQQGGGNRDRRSETRAPFGRPGFIERLDRDGDGKVSRPEFDGPKERFRFHDSNNDGYLTEDEAPQGPPPGGGRPPRRIGD
ncbi:MAG: DUF1566 domain-containing protein [Candidatus Sedimenticola sp. (ex Thyasira tokunagai)]